LRAAIHQLANNPAEAADAEKTHLTGRLAYLHMLNPGAKPEGLPGGCAGQPRLDGFGPAVRAAAVTNP
jgi:hypothetical protein